MLQLTINILKSTDGGYVSHYMHPTINGAMVASQGDSIPELLENLADAHNLVESYFNQQEK